MRQLLRNRSGANQQKDDVSGDAWSPYSSTVEERSVWGGWVVSLLLSDHFICDDKVLQVSP